MVRHPVVFETLGPHHDIADFTCSNQLFVHYLTRQAGQDVRRRSATVIVARDSARNTVAGYYTISAFGIALEGLPSAFRKRLPRYPVVPAVLVGRLAVDTRYQGQGVGGLLLVDAISRAADLEVAVWGVVVDAIDASAVRFYEHFGFMSLLDTPNRLVLLIATYLKTRQ